MTAMKYGILHLLPNVPVIFIEISMEIKICYDSFFAAKTLQAKIIIVNLLFIVHNRKTDMWSFFYVTWTLHGFRKRVGKMCCMSGSCEFIENCWKNFDTSFKVSFGLQIVWAFVKFWTYFELLFNFSSWLKFEFDSVLHKIYFWTFISFYQVLKYFSSVVKI